MTKHMLFAGFGGQGVLFAGKMAAYSGMMDGKEVSWLPSYGPEMRGGTANCSVCVSDDPIASPLVVAPDVLVVMNNPSFDKFIDTVAPGGVVVADSSLVDHKTDRTDISVFYVAATKLADEKELYTLANMILMGKLIKETGFTTMDCLKKAFEKTIPSSRSHLLDGNIKAVTLGMEQ